MGADRVGGVGREHKGRGVSGTACTLLYMVMLDYLFARLRAGYTNPVGDLLTVAPLPVAATRVQDSAPRPQAG